jgi:predicted kinase
MHKVVVLTIGAPASGKSTWAQENLNVPHPEVRQVLERDEIREELRPGYTYQNKIDKDFERKVTEVLFDRVEAFFIGPKVRLIISDTNLNPRHREKLIQKINEAASKSGNSVGIQYQYFFDSRNLDRLIDRNRKRAKQVPEDVIVNFHKKFMHLTPPPAAPLDNKNLIFVGDIHGQTDLFLHLFDHFDDPKNHLILLGDINDPRLEVKNTNSFLKLYEFIKHLVNGNRATLIYSNHQKNLIAALRGRRKKASWGLKETLDELVKQELIEVDYDKEDPQKILEVRTSTYAKDMANWLDARPYYFKNKAQGVIGVHAQYLPQYCDGPYSVSGRGLEAAIYGTKHKEDRKDLDNRIRWWETYNEEPYVIAGHYHEMFVGEKCAIIDSGCGEGGPLTAYDFTNKKVVQFGEGDL